MNRYLPTRRAIRISLRAAVLLAVSCAFGADAPPQQATAQVIDHAEFLCDNCFFGPSHYYYCLAAGNKILVGYQKTPVLDWRDKSKNYLTPAHPGWESWSATGAAVPISYDSKHIWVDRAPGAEPKGFGGHVKAAAKWLGRWHGEKVRLTQSAKRDMFHDERCRAGK